MIRDSDSDGWSTQSEETQKLHYEQLAGEQKGCLESLLVNIRMSVKRCACRLDPSYRASFRTRYSDTRAHFVTGCLSEGEKERSGQQMCALKLLIKR